jgi:hypothetical protein
MCICKSYEVETKFDVPQDPGFSILMTDNDRLRCSFLCTNYPNGEVVEEYVLIVRHVEVSAISL